jgi:chromatin-remodeling ATPase INO80
VQAIKSSSSIRWKTLQGFACRNRLLLSGTPIQNNMAELWALLHFIMPSLFDSQTHFHDWFSKGQSPSSPYGVFEFLQESYAEKIDNDTF